MQKRDFIQHASLQCLALTKNEQTGKYDVDLALAMAEKLWAKLTERGYGDLNKKGPREIPKAYDELKKHPVMRAAFDLFWSAFDYKENRDRAAARWLQMGEQTKQEYDRIIAAAKREAVNRKKLPEGRVPKMAEGWLTDRRWSDREETEIETAQKHQQQRDRQLRELNQTLVHAKKMAEQTGDAYWHSEIQKLTDQLRHLRDQPHD
jgi:hypothetical protein